MSDWDETTNVADPAVPPPKKPGDQRAYIIVLAGQNVGELYKVASEPLTLGRGGAADVRLVDEGISRFHCRIAVDGGEVYLEDLTSRNGTFLNGERVTRRALKDGDKIQLGRATVLKFSLHDQLEESFQRRMFDSALRDGLTRAYNKRYFLDRLQGEVRFSLRHRSPLALLLFDLDHFKQVNDSHGHLAGDRVLADFAGFVLDSIRHEDVFARYGGEEFVILCRMIGAADATRFAERLRRGTEALRIEHQGTIIPISASIGIACLPELAVDTANGLLMAADRALYQAKALGRNRAVMARIEMLEGTDPGDDDLTSA